MSASSGDGDNRKLLKNKEFMRNDTKTADYSGAQYKS